MDDAIPPLLQQYFTDVAVLTDNAEGNFGDNYRATRADGTERFVKVREQSDDNWFLWGLRKEHALTSTFGANRSDIPESDILLSDERHLAVGFPMLQTETGYGDLYRDVELYRNTVDDLISLRKGLDAVALQDYPALSAIYDNDQWYNGELGNTVDYFFEDRFAGGVFFSDMAYEQYEPLLETCRNKARELYNPEERYLIHGDLSNSANVILNDGGVEAVVDWEMTSWFDRRVDVAAIETAFIDDIARHNDALDVDEERAQLRERLSLSAQDERAVEAYKAWQHYVALEVYLSSDTVPFNIPEPSSIEAARARRYAFLDELATTFDVSL